MAKELTSKKKKQDEKEASVVHDIINKVIDNQKEMDRKLEEISLICSGKQCKAK